MRSGSALKWSWLSRSVMYFITKKCSRHNNSSIKVGAFMKCCTYTYCLSLWRSCHFFFKYRNISTLRCLLWIFQSHSFVSSSKAVLVEHYWLFDFESSVRWSIDDNAGLGLHIFSEFFWQEPVVGVLFGLITCHLILSTLFIPAVFFSLNRCNDLLAVRRL